MLFLQINNFYFIDDMLLCLIPLRVVSICLLLYKRANYFTVPIDGTCTFSKGHL